jgi:membrane protein YdbS with pleckstrin-like domain
MNFQNNQITTTDIPQAEDVIYEKLDPAYRKVSIWGTSILFSVFFIIYFGIGWVKQELFEFPYIMIAMILWSVLTGLFILLAIKGYDFEGFALREKDVLYKSGIFFRSTIIIPFSRVQHCEIEQGPIDRMFGLAELSLYTAGGSSSDLSIPGLTLDKANALKIFITNRVAADEEE